MKRSSAKAQYLYAGLVFVVAICVYTYTLAPTVTPVDSGELITAARFAGNAHPPGFPLYLMLAHLASLVPFGNVAVRVNFASAFFAAAAAALLTLVISELIMAAPFVAKLKQDAKGSRRSRNKAGHQSTGKSTQDDSVDPNWSLFFPAVIAGLVITFSRTLWSYATIAEVYTLNTLLILVIFFLVLRWRRRIVEDARFATSDRKRVPPAIVNFDSLLYGGAIVFGFALGVHHVTVGLMLPALAVIVYRTQGIRFFASRRLFFAAIVSFAALVVVYSYLPLAAAARPIINWGDPHTLESIWRHITGKQYQAFFSFTPDVIAGQLTDFGRILLREFGPRWLPALLLVAICGSVYAFKSDRTTFWFLIVMVVANLVYGSFYEIAEDKDAYYLPTFVSVTILGAFGLRWFGQRFDRTSRGSAVAFGLILPAIALAGNWPFDNRRHDFIAHDYVENIENVIAPNSLLLTFDWQVASPMFYTREVEGRRRDIEVVDINLLRRPWYLEYLARSFPDLIGRSGNEFDAFRAQLQAWDRDPSVYARSPVLTRRIHDAFRDLLRSLITKNMEHASVYITQDILFLTGGEEKELTQWINENYQAFPQGLVFELSRDRGFHDPGNYQLQTRALSDGTMKFEKDDVVDVKIAPVYRMMLINRGRYLLYFNQPERAAEAFKEALAFDRNCEPAKQALAEIEKKSHAEATRP